MGMSARQIRAAVVAMALGAATLAACDTSDPSLTDANDALRELGLPTLTRDLIARDSVWRVIDDSSTAGRQLVLVHSVAALHLPDGPFELLAPLTYFVYRDSAWVQETQQRGGLALSLRAASLLASDFTDTSRVYFYSARAVTLADTSDRADTTMSLASRIQRAVRGITTDVARWRRSGFIGADAEP